MSARRIITMILSLGYLVVLILCAYTPILPPAAPVIAEEGVEEQVPSARPEIALPFITPRVTLTAGSFPEDSEELRAQIVSGETALLDQFTKLRRADFSGSTCVEEIAAWAAANPQVDVTYTVSFPNGTTVDNTATTLDLSTVDTAGAQQAIHLMTALPALKNVELGVLGSGGFSQTDLATMNEVMPDVDFHYGIEILGQVLSPETETLDLSTASAEDVAAALQVIPSMTNLKTLHLGAEGGVITWDTIDMLNRACPEVSFDYGFQLWGVNANLSDEGINFTHIKMDDEGEAVRRILPYMHNLRGVDMDSCGVSNAAMAQIRAENPGVNVVWRVNFGTDYSVRTDVEKILASKPSKGGMLTNKDAISLGYCTKLKYLDIGHNSDLTDGSFFANFPDLEVLIISQTGITDISSLANCPHLEYLEIQHTGVSDISALRDAKELRHLNIGDSRVSDISPLFGLTEMERLYICAGSLVPAAQAEEMKSIAPNCEVNTIQDKTKPDEGQWRYSDHVSDEAYIKFAQNGYVGFPFEYVPRYALLREQFGYDNAAYAFSWLDPLY